MTSGKTGFRSHGYMANGLLAPSGSGVNTMTGRITRSVRERMGQMRDRRPGRSWRTGSGISHEMAWPVDADEALEALAEAGIIYRQSTNRTTALASEASPPPCRSAPGSTRRP